MKKLLLFFIIAVFSAQSAGLAAVKIVKAPAVAKQEAGAQSVGASLVPTALNLIQGVKSLSQKQKELTGECVPTSSEISWVNNMIKEWAKTGAMTAEEAATAMGMEPCDRPTGEYEESVRLVEDTDNSDFLCFDWFGASSDQNTVWYKFPMASKGYYCTDGSGSSCTEKNKKEVSNIYHVFSLIEFSDSDYTADELATASKLRAKVENCSSAKLSARNKAMWGEFLTTTIGGLGQKTNSASIMDVVSGVAGSVGGGGGFNLQSLSGVAGQLFQQ